jgi:hypothetical protein
VEPSKPMRGLADDQDASIGRIIFVMKTIDLFLDFRSVVLFPFKQLSFTVKSL